MILPEVSLFVSVFFALTTALTVFLFDRAVRKGHGSRTANRVLIGLIAWVGVQGGLAASGFFLAFEVMPPRFLLAVGPPLGLLAAMFFLPKGRAFMDGLAQPALTWMHTVRVPVELTLYWLFVAGLVPELMTFAGRNVDILAGLTAPLVAYFGLTQGKINRKTLLIWNVVALGLVMFIVANAILSAPLPIQQFAFEQPNLGVFYLPFNWLPSVVVPLVFLGHVASIRQLLRSPVAQEQPEKALT
ncbi:MAG: hypothetical protein AAF399_14125 [Bacteroidota bacterium]